MGHRLSKEQRMQQEQNSKPNEFGISVTKETNEHKLLLENNQNHLKLSTKRFPPQNLPALSSSTSTIATATAAAATSVIIIIRMLKMESNDCNKESVPIATTTTTNCTTGQKAFLSSSTNDVCCANTTDIDSSNTTTTTKNTTDNLANATHNQNVQKNNCPLNDLLNTDNLNLNNKNENIITHINNNNNSNINNCNSINDSLNLHSKNSKFCDTKNHICSKNNKINNNNFSDSDIKGLNVNLISETNYKKTIKEQQQPLPHQHHSAEYIEPDAVEQKHQQRSMATDDSCGKLMSMQHQQQQQQSTNAYHTMEPILKTKVKKSNNWKLNCAKLKSSKSSSSSSNSPPILTESLHNNINESPSSSLSPSSSNCESFMNISHNTKSTVAGDNNKTRSQQNQLIDFSRFNLDNFPIEDCDKTARIQRALEIAEGVEPPPGYQPSKISETGENRTSIAAAAATATATTATGTTSSLTNVDMLNRIQTINGDNNSSVTSSANPSSFVGGGSTINHTNSTIDVQNNEIVLNNRSNVNSACNWSLTTSDSAIRLMLPPVAQEISLFESIEPPKLIIHSQVDYIHCLVPDLKLITNCSFYWGKMDRYEAERLLEGKPEGTFLLRDSAQEEFLFSVSFRKYGRSLHARIEQFNHKFSFDCHDPGVYTSPTVTGLLEHYKDPACVMFFEPALTLPLNRNFCFSLKKLCRATIVSHTSYDGVANLMLPKKLESYLKEYHYRQRVRIKRYDDPIYNNS